MTYIQSQQISPPVLTLTSAAKRLHFSAAALSLITTSLLLVGCATTQTLTTAQCQTSNWQEVGYNDGLHGRSGAYFGHYSGNCSKVGGALPNRVLWEKGRLEGLGKYCTQLNAYQLGREGYDWQPVCPLEGIEQLEEAYAQGRYYYLRQRDLDYLSSPYPFGYGRFGYRPIGYGFFGYP